MTDDKQHDSQSPTPSDPRRDSSSRIAPGTPNRPEFVIRPGEEGRVHVFSQDMSPRRGGEGDEEVCKVLMKHVNTQGAGWRNVVSTSGLPEEGVDCTCESPQGVVKFQVTRAIRDEKFFEVLGKHKAVTVNTSDAELSQKLWESIEHKANRTAPVDRGDIVLVLDAFDIHFAQPTVTSFVATYGEQARSLGFQAIWLVGSYGAFIYQLA